MTSVQVAEREHPVHSSSERPCAEWAPPPPPPVVVGTSDAPDDAAGGGSDPPETEAEPPADDGGWEYPYFNPDLYDDPPGTETPTDAVPVPAGERECLVEYHCGGERIDEMFTGEISGEPPKAYAEYVSLIGGILSWLLGGYGPDVSTAEGFNELSDWVLDAGLGPQPSILYLPVFYYCRIGPGGPIELGEAAYLPDFGWDTDVVAEFDVITTRTTLVDEATATLKAEQPEMRAIPPLEQGFTYVKFPMWLWLEDPIEELTIEAFSSPATVRVAIRATFDKVVWDLGEETVTCTLEDMREYPGEGATENVPECSYRFLELVDFELTAEVFYNVEEQVTYRGAEALPWPNAPWVVHPTDPVISTDQSAGEMSVHELLSLNVNEVD